MTTLTPRPRRYRSGDEWFDRYPNHHAPGLHEIEQALQSPITPLKKLKAEHPAFFANVRAAARLIRDGTPISELQGRYSRFVIQETLRVGWKLANDPRANSAPGNGIPGGEAGGK